jgi:hypothetical protein
MMDCFSRDQGGYSISYDYTHEGNNRRESIIAKLLTSTGIGIVPGLFSTQE